MNKRFIIFHICSVLHNFADGNTLFAFAENVSKLLSILQSEFEVIIDWLVQEKPNDSKPSRVLSNNN